MCNWLGENEPDSLQQGLVTHGAIPTPCTATGFVVVPSGASSTGSGPHQIPTGTAIPRNRRERTTPPPTGRKSRGTGRNSPWWGWTGSTPTPTRPGRGRRFPRRPSGRRRPGGRRGAPSPGGRRPPSPSDATSSTRATGGRPPPPTVPEGPPRTGFWTWRGQTPGKMIAGIKIVRTDGSSIGLGRAFIRYLMFVVGSIAS